MYKKSPVFLWVGLGSKDGDIGHLEARSHRNIQKARIHDSTAYLLSDGRIEVDGFVSSNRYPGNGEDLSVEVSVNDGKGNFPFQE